jgi:hypothetical protein
MGFNLVFKGLIERFAVGGENYTQIYKYIQLAE